MESTMTAPAPLTAHLTSPGHSSAPHSPPKGVHLGREHIKWSPKVWERIDRAVHHEMSRTRVATRFLPQYRVDPHVTPVPAETVLAGLNTSTPFALPVAGAVASTTPT